MSYTEHPDIDAARWMQEEERKALELEWLIEEESKKECYNPFLIENIVEALCELSDDEVELIQQELYQAQEYHTKGCHRNVREMVFTYSMDAIIEASEIHQEKRIIENVMKGK